MEKKITVAQATVKTTHSEIGLTKETKAMKQTPITDALYLNTRVGKQAQEIVNVWTTEGYKGKTLTKYEHTDRYAFKEATKCSIIPMEDRWIICYAVNSKTYVLNAIFGKGYTTAKYEVEVSECKSEVRGDFINHTITITKTPIGKTSYYKTAFTYGERAPKQTK